MAESVETAINEFYKLKNKYETELFKKNKIILNNVTLSSKEKKNEFKKLKPKCIDCNRHVGTTFSIAFNKEKDGRILSAVCGDKVDPCNLNINIFLGYTETYPEIIKGLENDIKKIKNEIIVDKNKLLFGFITTEQALDNFDSYSSTISEKTERLTSVLELYLNETDNTEVNETIRTLQSEIYLTIGYIKDAMTSYDRTNNSQFVQDSVNIFVNQLTPKMTQMMNLKYNYNNVELENGVFRLVQKKTSIEQIELTYNDSTVNSFEYKTIAYKQKLTKTKTAKNRDSLSKNKTLKIRPGLTIEDSDYEDEQDVYSPVEEAKYTITPDGFVVWKDQDYQQLWDKLSQQLKTVLTENPAWMETSMDQYIVSKKAGKEMVFREPPNLIIPPNEMPDGSYDFGNELYNDFYNDPSNSVYKTFNPSMLRDAMNNAVAKQLGFKKIV